jgi:hypothetical protein
MDEILFSPHPSTQYLIMTNQTQVCRHFCKNKYHIHISILTFYSVLCWSTFGSDYSLESFGVWCYTCIWGVSPILLCRSSQALSGGLQLSCRNISRMINGNRMHLRTILSLISKGLNTYVNKVFYFIFFANISKNLLSLCPYGLLCVVLFFSL